MNSFCNSQADRMHGLEWKLAAIKSRAEKQNRDWRAQWQGEKYSRLNWKTARNWSRAIGGDFKGAYHADNFTICDFQYIGEAHRIVMLNHTGWYADDIQNNICRGHVMAYRMRRRPRPRCNNSRTVYCPAVDWSAADGVAVWPLDWYETPEEAARAADSIAESIAENERDYQEAWRAANDASEELEEARAAIRAAREQFHALARDYRASRLVGSVCELLRAKMRTLRHTVRRNVAELPDLIEREESARNYLARLDSRIAANYPQA